MLHSLLRCFTSSFLLSLISLPLVRPASAQAANVRTVEALVYSTMPSNYAHRPTMAMDGRTSTYFKSTYSMSGGDDFKILLSSPTVVKSIRIVTGDDKNQDILTNGFVETSANGTDYKRLAAFDHEGVAQSKFSHKAIQAIRIRLNPRQNLPSLVIREISIVSATPISHVQTGPGRGFADISRAPDLAIWANKAEQQMESFWPDTQALLYSPQFVTPNEVNVVYRTGPGVTPVAATGGGVMTVDSLWCRQHPEDTGLTVHEMSHVVQSYSAYNPVWLVEGIADYVRWIAFEPENYHPRINPATATYHDSYRTSATFLAWCQLHYDSRLVTKLSDAVRFGRYDNGLFKANCGKDVDSLWSEFIAAYKSDPDSIISPPLAPADRPRVMGTVKPNSSVPVDLKPIFNILGFTTDGFHFGPNEGFDAGGAAYSASQMDAVRKLADVKFQISKADEPNTISCRGNSVTLPSEQFSSLWLLGAAVEGNQTNQNLVVTYTDGSAQTLSQNFSDWFTPQNYVGEDRAARMTYRNMADGTRDNRAFAVYRYGFPIDSTKIVSSLTLPGNPNIKILAVSLTK